VTDEPAQAMVAAFNRRARRAIRARPACMENRAGTPAHSRKAVEQLGDRWNLNIIRELTIHGARGFNALADGMPGISRARRQAEPSGGIEHLYWRARQDLSARMPYISGSRSTRPETPRS
jgi:hypothetical protein